MTQFLSHCKITGFRVQGFVTHEVEVPVSAKRHNKHPEHLVKRDSPAFRVKDSVFRV